MNSIAKHRTFYIIEGAIFILLGIFAIALPGFFTLSIELLLGWLLIISGAVQIYRTFTAKEIPGFWASLFSAILYIVVGVLLLIYPLVGILSLTLLLMLLFFFQGIAQIIWGFQAKGLQGWGWYVFSGIISLLLAILIWSEWPSSALWVIGILVGVNLLFLGIAQVVIAASAPSQE